MKGQSKIGPGTRLTPPSDVCSRQFEDAQVVLDLRGGDYFGLDDVAGCIWDQLVKGHSAQEVAHDLCSEYEVDYARVLDDVIGFARILVEKGLMVVDERHG